MANLLDVSIKVPDGFKFADFDVQVMKRGLRKEGAEIAKVAKKLVSKRGVSEPGGFPGKQSGVLRKSVKSKVSRSGFTATIKPWLIADMDGEFYPAYVYYGHRAPKSRTAQDNRSRQKTAGLKVAAPRENFILVATQKIGASKLQADLAKLADKALAAKEVKL